MLEAFILLTVVVFGVALILARRRVEFVILLASVLLFQNLGTMVLLRLGWVSGPGAQVLLATKESLLVVGVIALVGHRVAKIITKGRFRLSPIPTFAILWVLLVFVHAASSGPPWLARLAGVRSVVVLPTLFLFGYWLALSPKSVQRMIRLMIVIGVLLAGFGVLEAYVLPESFWLTIGHEEFYLEKIGRPIQDRLYNNMRYWIGGNQIRRVASLTGDPLISSYPMAMVIVMLAARYVSRGSFRAWHALVILLVGFATVLTLSRGAFLTVAIAAGFLPIAKRSVRMTLGLTGLALAAIVAGTTLFGEYILKFTTGAGHINELVQGLQRGAEKPLGHGLGVASSLAAGIARSSGLDSLVIGGGDSFMGSLATQMGLVAMLLFYILMLSMLASPAWQFKRLQSLRSPIAWWFGAAVAMQAGLLVTSSVNESGFGFVASGLIYILVGALHSLGETDLGIVARAERADPASTRSELIHV